MKHVSLKISQTIYKRKVRCQRSWDFRVHPKLDDIFCFSLYFRGNSGNFRKRQVTACITNKNKNKSQPASQIRTKLFFQTTVKSLPYAGGLMGQTEKITSTILQRSISKNFTFPMFFLHSLVEMFLFDFVQACMACCAGFENFFIDE